MPLSSLAGNRALKAQLLPRLSGGTLGHAFILAGPAGSGKHKLASILAQAMVCSGQGTKPCGSCPACKKALAGIHPDIVTIAPLEDKKAINVDQVRQMRADAYIRPNEAVRKVYILEQTEQMRDEAQNAMLKLLEEGPAYAAFLLLTDNPGSLLITVRSRCEVLTLTADEPAVQAEPLARSLVELWLAGDEAGLMEQCAVVEKWDREQFSALVNQMRNQFCAVLPTAADPGKALKGAQLLAQVRRALELNIGPGSLYAWMCAACAQ